MGRVVAIVVLLAVGIGVPVVLVSTVGSPWPSGNQWAQLRERGRVDTDMVIRLGLTMVSVLWLWFCASAVHELFSVIAERRSGVHDAPGHDEVARPGRRASWVRRLVRLAVLGGVATAAVFATSALVEPGTGTPTTSEVPGRDPTPASVAPAASSTEVSLAPVVSVMGLDSGGVESGGGVTSDIGSARSAARWPITALGGLAALGVVGGLARRRRHQLRTTVPGDVVAVPSSTLIEVEESVRALAVGEDMARVDFALAVAADALERAGSAPLLVVVDSRGGIRMLPTASAVPDDGMWQLDSRDGWWVVQESVDLVDLATAAQDVERPGLTHLVELGQLAESTSTSTSDGARVLVDIAHARRLDLVGTNAVDVARALCIGLAAAEYPAPVRVVSFGLNRAPAWSASIRECADVVEWESELALALSPGSGEEATESWIGVLPAEVVASCSATELEKATALITWSESPAEHDSGFHPRLLVSSESATLEPWGLTVIPVRVPAEVADLVAELVTAPVIETVACPEDEVEDMSTTDDSPVAEFEPPVDESEAAPVFVVRLLGPVRVESADGEVVEFERSKALELVAWLATHRSRPTRGRARAALWEVDVRTATFHNVISDARRSMARLVAPPVGEEWIARSESELLPIHSSVVCDLDLVEQAVEASRDLDDDAAVDVLRPVVELLEGSPFSGTDYLWSDSEGIASAAVLAATSAATLLARRCLALGDTAGVFAATGRGLAVLPGHEELVALRLRAHDATGDRAGVRDEWERYLRVLAADAWPGDGDGATPPPKMLALRRTLLP